MEGRKKQARSNKRLTRQSNTAHPRPVTLLHRKCATSGVFSLVISPLSLSTPPRISPTNCTYAYHLSENQLYICISPLREPTVHMHITSQRTNCTYAYHLSENQLYICISPLREPTVHMHITYQLYICISPLREPTVHMHITSQRTAWSFWRSCRECVVRSRPVWQCSLCSLARGRVDWWWETGACRVRRREKCPYATLTELE